MLNKTIFKEALGILPSILKDNKGKWSSKRTISGVLVGVIANYLQTNPLSWMVIAFTFVAVLPLCMSFLEIKNECCKIKNK